MNVQGWDVTLNMSGLERACGIGNLVIYAPEDSRKCLGKILLALTFVE